MLEILEFIFESYAHFWGTWWLLVTIFLGVSQCIPSISWRQVVNGTKKKEPADGS